MKTWWRNYSLSIVAGVLFLVTWIAFGVTKWFDYRYELQLLGVSPDAGHYAMRFLALTLQVWQSDILNLLMFVVLGALFIHKNSSQSKDSTDEIQEALARIESRMNRMDDVRR